MRSVAVFGGTGFLGRDVVNQLVAAGMKVRVAVRHPEPINLSTGRREPNTSRLSTRMLLTRSPSAGPWRGATPPSMLLVYTSSGGLTRLGPSTNSARCMWRGSRHVLASSLSSTCPALVPISTHNQATSRSRARGELLVREAFPAATMLRPSVLFGPDDKFLNTLITIVRRSPVLALFGAGNTRLQPVYVGDVAKAVLRVLTTPSSQGKVYELGGPQIYRYRDLIKLVLKEADRSRILVPLPFFIWDTLARLLMLLPDPPLTTDVVTLMRQDNVVGAGVSTFADLGLAPTSVKAVLPVMLGSRP